ncbi:DUF2085 domain-containing protein [bacterium]|nr:DUF2085 domain-containing protein [bacterium]
MPDSPYRTRNFFADHWLLLANGVFTLLLVLIILAPYLSSAGSKLSGLIYYLFKPTCHQEPARSYFIFGKQLPVCARCTGIYVGMFIGGILFAIFRKKVRKPLPLIAFIILILPLWIDGLGQTFKFWNTGNLFRTLTGLVCSIAVVFFVYPYIDERV